MKNRELSLAIAEKQATELLESLSSACERLSIAGSIRRRRPQIHDVDLVAVPKYEEVPPQTLFGEPEKQSVLETRLNDLVLKGHLRIVERGTKTVRVERVPEQLPVDIYIATPLTWPTLLLIRTGSREHNIKLCTLAKQRGMQLKADGSGLFRGAEILAGESEESIFRALGLSYVQPEFREAHSR